MEHDLGSFGSWAWGSPDNGKPLRERQVQICLSEMSLWRQRGVIEGLKLEAGRLSALRQLVRTLRQQSACIRERRRWRRKTRQDFCCGLDMVEGEGEGDSRKALTAELPAMMKCPVLCSPVHAPHMAIER